MPQTVDYLHKLLAEQDSSDDFILAITRYHANNTLCNVKH